MTMLEGTALAFLKLGAIAAVIAAVIMMLSRYLVRRQLTRAGAEANGSKIKVEADIDGR